MNGEVELNLEIIKDLRGKENFELKEYICSLTFQFYKKSIYFSKNNYDFKNWKKRVLKQKKDFFILLPNVDNKEYQTSGFVNATKQGIYIKGKTSGSLWVSTWTFDDSIKEWRVFYKEYPIEYPEYIYKPQNNLEAFKDTLKDITELAYKINEIHWGNYFEKAYKILLNDSLPVSQKLEEAVYQSNVFGGMGSWVDSPPYSAHEYNLSKEYEKLTQKLYEQRKIALMVAINNSDFNNENDQTIN